MKNLLSAHPYKMHFHEKKKVIALEDTKIPKYVPQNIMSPFY